MATMIDKRPHLIRILIGLGTVLLCGCPDVGEAASTGTECTKAGDCISEICLLMGATSFCSSPCVPGMAVCPTGMVCSAVVPGSTRSYCVWDPNQPCGDGVCSPAESEVSCPADCGSCVAECQGRECGDDGCGGSCGNCELDQTCDSSGHCTGGAVLYPQDGSWCGANISFTVSGGGTSVNVTHAEYGSCSNGGGSNNGPGALRTRDMANSYPH